MLHNTYDFLTPIQTCLLELKNVETDFFLTGSRFFGGTHANSDWDFIMQDNKFAQQFLINLGFKINEDVQDYLDPMTSTVLTKYFCSCEEIAQEYGDRIVHGDECLKIDIQMCHDFDTKLRVRDILKKGFKARPLPGDKLQRNRLWTMVYNLVKPS